MARMVMIPSGKDVPRWVRCKWSPAWSQAGEQPLHVGQYPDGELRWYGSGSAVAVVRAMPISVRLPVGLKGEGVYLIRPAGFTPGGFDVLRKVSGAAPAGASPGGQLADRSTWPLLVEYLTATVYPDGQPRQVASLIIVADSSVWKGCVSDKDNDRTLWRSSSTLEGLLLEIEQALTADDPASWRQAGGGFKGRRKRS